MELRIRRIEERDVVEVDRIFRLAFCTFLGVTDPLTVFGDSDMVRTRFRAAPDSAFVAEADGQLVGSNFLTRWGSFGFFGPLTIEPRLWDRGVAKRLMEPTMQLFDEWKCSSVGLFTFAHSPKHVSLYQKFGFWPRFLTPVMSKSVTRAEPVDGYVTLSSLRPENRAEVLAACRKSAGLIYDGLDVTREIEAVDLQKLGETLIRFDESKVSAFAVCHLGAGSEAGSGDCYVKFGCVRPGAGAKLEFERLLAACEHLASTRAAARLVAGVNVGRHEAYRAMLARGFRTDLQGVAMHRDNDPGYCRPSVFVIDDWR
jgi:GNAT superfamily N-acetyltransferase